MIAISQKIKWTIHLNTRHKFGHFRARIVFSISWRTHTLRVQNGWLVGAQHGWLVTFSSSSMIFNWTVSRLVAWLGSSPTSIAVSELEISRLKKSHQVKDCLISFNIPIPNWLTTLGCKTETIFPQMFFNSSLNFSSQFKFLIIFCYCYEKETFFKFELG